MRLFQRVKKRKEKNQIGDAWKELFKRGGHPYLFYKKKYITILLRVILSIILYNILVLLICKKHHLRLICKK